MNKSAPKYIQYLQRNPNIKVVRTTSGWLCCNGRFELELTVVGELVTELELYWRGSNGITTLARSTYPEMTTLHAAFALAGGE